MEVTSGAMPVGYCALRWLSSQRVYKEPWAQGQVLDELMKERGKHFDPEMIDAFFIALDSITAVGKRYV